ADERYKDIPIIMVTTEGGKAEVITALKAGVNNYIVKPFTPQVLKEKL
ncbi:MAG: response regulator, partial [Helicobacter sp.]|nr:response regulator [Helicobacter sp.]MDY5739980.1 response regulator [Helicobacter sp.]